MGIQENVAVADTPTSMRFRAAPIIVLACALPAVIPAEACHLGWQESLNLLALLVEADIPG